MFSLFSVTQSYRKFLLTTAGYCQLIKVNRLYLTNIGLDFLKKKTKTLHYFHKKKIYLTKGHIKAFSMKLCWQGRRCRKKKVRYYRVQRWNFSAGGTASWKPRQGSQRCWLWLLCRTNLTDRPLRPITRHQRKQPIGCCTIKINKYPEGGGAYMTSVPDCRRSCNSLAT